MATVPYVNDSRPSTGKASTSQSNSAFGQGGSSIPLPPPGTSHNPHTVYQHIQDTASKRISTLDYLRKAILDLNASSPLEYLRALNALLVEFESYQQIHSPDGLSSSSLSRARIPQMFKRAAHGAGTKGRRTSSAADIGLPLSSSDPADLRIMTNNMASAGSSVVTFPISEQELLPGEEYTHLLTPSLPFDPDFFEVFATLCDVLIDCYTRIIGLLPSPAMCAPGVGEMFAKADTRLRKVIVQGIVKEFEDASRSGAKFELAGVNKVVLGGLV
ncbi:MAG: hypothetical protein L6R35_005978 [Caloplaca aegaea]|nr:MAG: hypothetical protein L6R35_005978 [Caloplaca aegaea]